MPLDSTPSDDDWFVLQNDASDPSVDADDAELHYGGVTECWRCEQEFDLSLTACPLCAANNRAHEDTPGTIVNQNKRTRSPAIVRVVWAFVVLAALSIGYVFLAALSPPAGEPGTLNWCRQTFAHIGIIELISTVVVVASFFLIPVKPTWPEVTTRRQTYVWLGSVPLLAGVLALNLAYHHWLQLAFGVEAGMEDLIGFRELWPVLLITICVQPAIVEELFFRHVALGAALEATPAKQAVFISAVLFAFAHLGTPLSIPTLTLLGVVLGALRLLSGGLLLPMLFHFFHNLVVILLEPVF